MDATPQVQGGASRRPKLRRVLRLLLWLLCILVLVAGIAAYLLYRAAGASPSWYVPPDPAASSQPAREAENKLIAVQSWTGARYAFDYARARGNGRSPLAQEPESRLTITFAEDEVNAMLQKWFVVYGEEKVGGRRVMEMLSNPMMHLTSDHVTFAATLVDMDGRVMSVDFRPEVLADGQLNLQLLAIHAGGLPVPEFIWSKLRTKLVADLTRQLPKHITKAAIDRGGGANSACVSAICATQAIATLEHRPAINVMFLPVITESVALPLRVESIDMQEGSLTLTAQVMTPEQRQGLLSHLQEQP